MINRKKGPQIHTDFDLSIENVEKTILPNGITLVELNAGTQDIIKIEMVLRCGRINESKIGASKAAILLMQEGSMTKSAMELAEIYDYYGASVKLTPGMEVSSMNLVCMTKFFKKLWPTWLEMILNPAYSEEEVNKFKTIRSQKLKNQLSKNEIISYRLISENIFGSDHPYGYNTEPEHILSLDRQDIVDYYEKEVTFDNAIVVVSGKFNSDIRDQIIESIGSIKKACNQSVPQFNHNVPSATKLNIPTENELQASIKIGCSLFSRSDPDYTAFNFVNTILGGYFGSRLMTNIREEKGYTYGIYSMLDCWNHGGFFYISSDVGSDLIEPTIDEIHKEIDILKTEPVDDKELNMVKNYILGQSLNLIDGPFATAQLIKSLYIKNLDAEDFQKNINTIKNMTSQTIINLANKYLDISQFSYVIVGGIK
jgi:predicted Zn-dependent peptidase